MTKKRDQSSSKIKKTDLPCEEDAMVKLPNNPLAMMPIKVSFTYQLHTLCNKKISMECQEIFIPKEQDLITTKECLKVSFQGITRNLLKNLTPHFTYENQ